MVDAEGRLRLSLVPRQPYTLRATQTGFETASRIVTAPAAGDAVAVVIDLAREPARSTLRVRLRGKVPPHAGFALFRPGATHPSVRRTVRASDGVFQLEKLPPGTWRVEILPGAAYYHPLSHYLQIEKQIDLREGATETIELEARTGGRLRLLPRTPRGEPARCECEILDSAGHRAGVRFYIPASGGWQHSESRIGPAPTEVGPALPPGRYRLRIFGENVVERILDVDLEGGKTSELIVDVRRP